jgi:hypothetical protein
MHISFKLFPSNHLSSKNIMNSSHASSKALMIITGTQWNLGMNLGLVMKSNRSLKAGRSAKFGLLIST